MKPENTTENKAAFMALYWGHNVMKETAFPNSPVCRVCTTFIEECKNWHLELKQLSSISDEDAIEIAKMIHEVKDNWVIVRSDDTYIHIERKDVEIGVIDHMSINFKYAHINANMHFIKTEVDESSSSKVNIGEVRKSVKNPVPYILIVDYLRSKGYALPWMGLSVDDLVGYGWIQLREVEK